jgi:hypothetical protein
VRAVRVKPIALRRRGSLPLLVGVAGLALLPGSAVAARPVPNDPPVAASASATTPRPAGAVARTAPSTPAARAAASSGGTSSSARRATPSPVQSLFINTLTSIPVFSSANPSAGALNQFEQFDAGSAFGLMLAVATVSLWGYWAGGLLLSGAGGTEVVESIIKIVLSGIAIVMWPTLFRDAVAIVNGLCGAIVNAPFAASAFRKLALKIGTNFGVTMSAAAGLVVESGLASGLRSALGIGAAGLSIADLVSTGNPIGWFIDVVVTLGFLIGQFIIEIERLALFATTCFLYVTGPIAIALTAFRGLTPVTGAFFRVAQAVLVIVFTWTVFLVLWAILDSAIAPLFWNQPKAWFATIGDNLTSLVMLWFLIFTPGMIRRQLGAGGGSAAGVLRTAAVYAGYRALRGGGGGRRSPAARENKAAMRAGRRALGAAEGRAPMNWWPRSMGGDGGRPALHPRRGGAGAPAPSFGGGAGRAGRGAPTFGGGGAAGPAPTFGGRGGAGGPAPTFGGRGGPGGPAPTFGDGNGGGVPAPKVSDGNGAGGAAPTFRNEGGAGAAAPEFGDGNGAGVPAPKVSDGNGAGGAAPTFRNEGGAGGAAPEFRNGNGAGVPAPKFSDRNGAGGAGPMFGEGGPAGGTSTPPGPGRTGAGAGNPGPWSDNDDHGAGVPAPTFRPSGQGNPEEGPSSARPPRPTAPPDPQLQPPGSSGGSAEGSNDGGQP